MSAEPRRDRTAPHTLYKTLLGASGAEALPHVDRDYWSSETILEEVGPEVIAEQLATGRLPVEVALMYEVPILHFRRWMRERITDDDLEEIRSAAAESLQVKAMLTLSSELKNPAEASQAKALSERFAKISEALSPKEWSPARIEAPGDMPSVTISFDGMGMNITATNPVAPPQERVINAEAPELVTSNAALGEGHLASARETLPTPNHPAHHPDDGYEFHPPGSPDDGYEFHPPRGLTTEQVLESADPFVKTRAHRPMSEGM